LRWYGVALVGRWCTMPGGHGRHIVVTVGPYIVIPAPRVHQVNPFKAMFSDPADLSYTDHRKYVESAK
uniref:hypothetical protein n=1 Tax=Salmonella enterica TaxID=28901 RepID=UPI00398C46D9